MEDDDLGEILLALSKEMKRKERREWRDGGTEGEKTMFCFLPPDSALLSAKSVSHAGGM